MEFFKIAFFLSTAIAHIFVTCSAQQSSFILSFHASVDQQVGVDQWAEYVGEVPRLLEFTVCHWEYLVYFNDVNSIWAYCFLKMENDTKPACTQYYSASDPSTLQKHMPSST